MSAFLLASIAPPSFQDMSNGQATAGDGIAIGSADLSGRADMPVSEDATELLSLLRQLLDARNAALAYAIEEQERSAQLAAFQTDMIRMLALSKKRAESVELLGEPGARRDTAAQLQDMYAEYDRRVAALETARANLLAARDTARALFVQVLNLLAGAADSAGDLPAGTEVSATLHSDPIHLGTTVANAHGAWALFALIPAGVPLGEHTVELTFTLPNGARHVENRPITIAAADRAPDPLDALLAFEPEPLPAWLLDWLSDGANSTVGEPPSPAAGLANTGLPVGVALWTAVGAALLFAGVLLTWRERTIGRRAGT